MLLVAITISLSPLPVFADDREDCESIELEDDEIIPACTRAIASGRYKGEQLAKLFWFRGLSYQIKQQRLALADFTAAIRAYPDYAAAYGARADIYLISGQLDLAINDYSEAIRLAPNGGSYYFSRAYAYQAKGDRARAIEDFRKTLQLLPDAKEAARELQRLGATP